MSSETPRPSEPDRWPRIAGIALVVGALQFLALTTAEALWLIYSGHGYNFLNNTISYLGDPSLVPYPYYWMLNGSVIALGLLVLLAVPGYAERRPQGGVGTGSAVLLALVGIGAIGVGIFNEHLDYSIHISSAALAFAGGGLVLLTAGIAAFRDPAWRSWAVPDIVGALITFVALGFFSASTTNAWGLGHGGWERLVVAPAILWVILAGIKFLRSPSGRSVAAVP